MSAAACSAGLFHPTKELLRQPIPVYIISKDFDTMLLRRRPCLFYSELYIKFMQSTTVKRKMRKYQKTFNVLKKYCGADVTNIHGASIIYDTLQIEVLKNKT